MTIHINKDACTGCSYCEISCPVNAISLIISKRVHPEIEKSLCTNCGECLYICPNNVFSSPELETPPIKLDNHYDAIIIGAGIGGLMTAAGLARAGKRVVVIEQLSFVGGKYTHLSYKGYAISTAAWTCAGPHSRIGKLCAKLGADIQWVTIHDKNFRGDHWIVTKDGKWFISTDEAQEALVGGSKGMAQVYKWISDMYDPKVNYPRHMTAREYIQNYFPDNEQYIKYVETIITYCFASQTIDNFSANETKRAVIDAIEQMADWGTAVGGTAAIVSALENVIVQHKGQIATRTRVSSILLDQGKAIGVTLSDGRSIYSDIVIHNSGLNRLLQLVGEQNLPPEYVTHLRSAIPANVAALVLGTSESLLGKEHSLLHAMDWERTLNCYAPTFFDPKLAPDDYHALDVFWVLESPINYQNELEIVKKQLHQIFPNFDNVVKIQIPMFFTGLWTAEMAHRLGQSGDERLDPQTPINNLYIVGYDCIGYGMAGDIIPHGVERTLHLILKDPSFAPLDEKSSIRFNKWLKSKLFRIMSLGKQLKN